MVYTSAVIHSVSIISSVENKRERTRSSCFVQVRFVKATGEEHCRPACIRKLVLIRPPVEEEDGGGAQPFRIAFCDVFKEQRPLGDADNGEVLRAHLTGSDSDYQHRMYPVDLSSIDSKLVMVATDKFRSSRINLGTGWLYFVTYGITTGQGPI